MGIGVGKHVDPDQTAPIGSTLFGSSLIWVYTVCHSVYIFWIHYSNGRATLFKFWDNDSIFLGVQIFRTFTEQYMSQLIRLWYLSQRQPAKAQASLCMHAVWQGPSLFAHMKYENRRRVRPKIGHLAPLDDCACALEE